jgi:hypothetical protein
MVEIFLIIVIAMLFVSLFVAGYCYAEAKGLREVASGRRIENEVLKSERGKLLDKLLVRQGSTPIYEDSSPPDETLEEKALPPFAAARRSWTNELTDAKQLSIKDSLAEALSPAEN